MTSADPNASGVRLLMDAMVSTGHLFLLFLVSFLLIKTYTFEGATGSIALMRSGGKQVQQHWKMMEHGCLIIPPHTFGVLRL